MSTAWPALRNIQVHAADIAVYPPGATYGPRRLRDFEFVWIMEGDATACYDDTRILAPAGTILLSRPGMTDRYDWGATRGATHAFFHFDFDRHLRGWPPLEQWPLSRATAPDDILRPLFRYVLGLRQLGKSQLNTLAGPCIELMLRVFLTGHVQTAAEPSVKFPVAVERALHRIGEVAFANPPQELRLNELSRVAAVSPEHLCRLFARHLNLGPLECLRLARLERAATLLSRSNMSSKEISEVTGFANPYHFSNAFKKVYQLSPTQYRGKIRDGISPPGNPIVRRIRINMPAA